ncbi:hypothetical protein NAT51_12835 [Flavobacterium amniphilum]|uniref:hypothetical protein n=1 Tax=Flavobacterium amniphilum TaxID=1834035 RepID=UPI00202A8385|nr:hypothetical protein [Flavobacterium amniphilum]MCL9805828.1 hypothetical protein [Flavobacterium amniphilum]MCL9806415.1 hypothetical protein [Flavobacterium amniphilum]
MDRVKNVVKFLQDNINVIILIPTVLGGFWQLIELLRIDTSFVRFFSITQVISDGLIILFLLICFYLIYLYVFKIEDLNLNDDKAKVKPPYENIFVKYILLILFLAMLGICIWSTNFDKISTSSFFFLLFFFIVCTKVYRDILLHHFGNDSYKYINVTVFILFALFIHFSDLFFKHFHKMYYVPFNLKNTKYIECYIDKKKNEFELLYFNDKFIFVQIKKTQEIEIINFEEMFKKDNCNENEKGNI